MKIRLIKFLIGWLWRHYKYLLLDAVIPSDSHLHKNPRKREVVNGEI
jgi:hypothetical protein